MAGNSDGASSEPEGSPVSDPASPLPPKDAAAPKSSQDATTTTTTTAETTTEDDKQKPPPPRRRKLRTIHLLLPYVLGLLWTSLHPLVSVVTGELKCRGSYIDESGLEPGHLRVVPYPTSTDLRDSSGIDGGGLCDAIDAASIPRSKFVGNGNAPTGERLQLRSAGNVACHSHGSHFDVVKIVPASCPAEPSEAIALVVDNDDSPGGGNWSGGDVHLSVLTLAGRLADPGATPWLSKTVLIVSPSSRPIGVGGRAETVTGENGGQFSSRRLDDTVHSFLDAYLGAGNGRRRTTAGGVATPPPTPLPPSLTSLMLRTVLVLNATEVVPSTVTTAAAKYKPELRILPQGRRGVLPNLDLVFAASMIFRGGAVWRDANVRVHPFHSWATKMESWIDDCLPKKARQYGYDLVGMLGFAASLVVGPYPPHAPILDRGIDSLTIEAIIPKSPPSRSRSIISPLAAELAQKLEHTIRALSNLHERLHHSITMYLLPSPTKFVSNGEYTYPSILVLLPLAIRAVSLALVDLDRFSFSVALRVVAICVGVVIFLLSFTGLVTNNVAVVNAALFNVYAGALLGVSRLISGASNKSDDENARRRSRRSLQFVACLTAIYTHVPITLAHVSLALPSAAFWTPLLAFPVYRGGDRGVIRRMLAAIFLFMTWPPILLVPSLFPFYSTYMSVIYTPLHLFLASLWLF